MGKRPVPGAKECLELMEDLGYPFRFVSNSTRRCRGSLAERLSSMGFSIPPDRIFTPPMAAISRMQRSGGRRCFLLATGDVHRDFEMAGLTLADQDVDFVVVGDAGCDFTYESMNKAFRLLLEGADLLALEQDRYWRGSEGLVLSAGPFVAALEYATGKRAELMGKPSAEMFWLALKDLSVEPKEAAMIGDDIITDVGGAKRIGMKGILVRTGKFSEELAGSSGITPDLVLGSLADLAGSL